MKSIICSVALLAVYSTAYAEDERQKLPAVEVIGQRISTFETDPDSSLQSVTVITREQFSGQITSLPEVLNQQAGIQVRSLGGHGSYTSYSVRGASGSQVGIYLNGMLLNNATGSSLDLSLIDLSSVEKIEIYKNYTPAIFARSNIGGAINIVTLKAKVESSVAIGFGSFATQGLRAHYGNENSSLIIKGLKSENNYPFYNSDAPFGDNKSQKRENNQLAQYSSYAYYRQKLSSTKYLDYSLLYSDKDKNQPTRQNFTNNQANLKNKIAIGSSLFSMPMFDGDFSIRTSILNRSEHFNDNLGLIGISQVKNQFDRNNRFEVAAGYNNYIGDLSTTWVNRASLEKYDSHDRTGRILRSQWQRTELASALSSLWEINPKWQSEATLAIEYYKDQQQNSNQPKQSDSLFSGHISVQYLPDYSNQLFANISQSHRLPGQRELFGNLGYSIANPDLQPEKAINSEIGWKYDVDNITISSSLFARSITNLITTIYDSRGIGRSENIAKADINGIELMLDYQWKQWQLNSSTTRQNSKQNSFFVAFDGKQLPGLFTFQQVLSAKYSIDNWGAGLSYQFSDGLFHNRAELAEATSNLELWSASASYTFGKHAIRTSLLNLLDKEYVLFNRYTAPGLELRITWNYQL